MTAKEIEKIKNEVLEKDVKWFIQSLKDLIKEYCKQVRIDERKKCREEFEILLYKLDPEKYSELGYKIKTADVKR